MVFCFVESEATRFVLFDCIQTIISQNKTPNKNRCSIFRNPYRQLVWQTYILYVIDGTTLRLTRSPWVAKRTACHGDDDDDDDDNVPAYNMCAERSTARTPKKSSPYHSIP